LNVYRNLTAFVSHTLHDYQQCHLLGGSTHTVRSLFHTCCFSCVKLRVFRASDSVILCYWKRSTWCGRAIRLTTALKTITSRLLCAKVFFRNTLHGSVFWC